MTGQRLIRTIYLYRFSVVGLVLVGIGAVGMIDLARLVVGLPLCIYHWRTIRREAS